MMVRDLFHQPHRMSLVPGFTTNSKVDKRIWCIWCSFKWWSPTLIVFAPPHKGAEVISALSNSFNDFSYDQVQVDHGG
ncbi:hypothetical protein KHA80_14680 [Anaerobacillus sp. HL2]|nr:hypothetical protein KHA80_14680 [Anaerobacillus sp. HL2]